MASNSSESADRVGADILAKLQAGRDLHQQGKLAEAERIYVDLLDRDPTNAEALHLLGMIAMQAGQPADAVELMSKAIASDPGAAWVYSNRAVAFASLRNALRIELGLNGQPSR